MSDSVLGRRLRTQVVKYLPLNPFNDPERYEIKEQTLYPYYYGNIPILLFLLDSIMFILRTV